MKTFIHMLGVFLAFLPALAALGYTIFFLFDEMCFLILLIAGLSLACIFGGVYLTTY